MTSESPPPTLQLDLFIETLRSTAQTELALPLVWFITNMTACPTPKGGHRERFEDHHTTEDGAACVV